MTTKRTAQAKKDPVEEVLSAIEQMTVTELAGLVSALKSRFGVSPMVVPAAQAPAQAAEAPKAEEPSEFKVTLLSVGEKKIQVLKELRALTNLGLKEAKDLIDGVPSVVREGVSKDEALSLKARLEAVGATVEVG
jgi:large subunit ribosomal protein L7/L12